MGLLARRAVLGVVLVVVATMSLGSTTGSASRTIPMGREVVLGAGVGVWDLYGVSCVAAACQVVGMTTLDDGYAAGSSDGGQHWTVEHVPSAVKRLEDVSCASALHCVAVGQSASSAGLALVTTNGGRSWLLHMLPGQPRYVTSISCPSTRVCFALANHAPTGGVVLSTQNGGAVWSHHALPPLVANVGELSCPTATVCEGLAAPSGNGALVLRTPNGGTAWSVRRLFTQPGSSAVSLSCPAALTCYALGGPSSPGHSVMKTINGARSWSTHSLGFRLGWTITCGSSTSCVAVGVGSSRVIAERSSNGGLSWSPSSPIPGGLSAAWKLSCSTVSRCVGVGDTSTGPHSLEGVAIRTVNGGVSWSAHLFP